MATIRAWAAVVTFACQTTTTPAESTLIFKHPAMNTTNTKEHYILLYSPNILSLIAIPSIDTCHSPSAPWHISSRTRPVLRKARCNSQGHGKSIHTRGSTPDSQTTFLLATLAPLQKRPLGICHCMRRCSQSRHKATYKDTSALKIIRQSSYISKEPHTTAVSKRLFIRRIHASHFDGFHVARSYGRFPQQHCGLEHIFFSAGSNIRSRSKTRSAALFPPQCWTYLFKIHLALVSLTWEGPPATFCKRFLLRLGKSSEAIFGAASVILWASLAPYADVFVPHPAQRASAQVRGTCHVKCGNRQRLRLVGLGRGTCGHCFAQLCLNVLFCCTTFSACSVDRSSSAKKL